MTGVEKFEVEDVLTTGERIYNLERYYNNLAGHRRRLSYLPKRFTHEPSTQKGSEGEVCHLDVMLAEYYTAAAGAMGWCRDGEVARVADHLSRSCDALYADAVGVEGVQLLRATGDGRKDVDDGAGRDWRVQLPQMPHFPPIDEDLNVRRDLATFRPEAWPHRRGTVPKRFPAVRRPWHLRPAAPLRPCHPRAGEAYRRTGLSRGFLLRPGAVQVECPRVSLVLAGEPRILMSQNLGTVHATELRLNANELAPRSKTRCQPPRSRSNCASGARNERIWTRVFPQQLLAAPGPGCSQPHDSHGRAVPPGG